MQAENQKKGGVFYGWILVVALFIVQMMPMALALNYASFFQVPVTAELGVSYAEFSIGAMCGSFGAMLFSLVLAGKLGRGNIRVWMTVGLGAAACAIFAQGFLTAIWQYWVLQFIMNFAFGAATFIPMNTLLDRWFMAKKGLAIGIVYAGAGVGGIIFSPILAGWIEVIGWRTSYMYIAGLTAIVAIIAFLFVRNSPADKGLKPLQVANEDGLAEESSAAAAPLELRGLMRSEALKSAALWLLLICLFCSGMIASGISSQLPTYIIEIGEDYALVMMFFSLGLVISQLLLGPVFDRFGVKIGGTVICIIVAAALIGLLLAPPLGVIFACIGAVLISFNAISNFVGTMLTGRFFGNLDFAGCFGVLNIAFMLGCMTGAPVVATLRTMTGTYSTAWIVMLVVVVLMELAFLLSLKAGKKLPERWHE